MKSFCRLLFSPFFIDVRYPIRILISVLVFHDCYGLGLLPSFLHRVPLDHTEFSMLSR